MRRHAPAVALAVEEAERKCGAAEDVGVEGIGVESGRKLSDVVPGRSVSDCHTPSSRAISIRWVAWKPPIRS